MGVGAGLSMYVVVVQKFTFAISSPDEFLYFDQSCFSWNATVADCLPSCSCHFYRTTHRLCKVAYRLCVAQRWYGPIGLSVCPSYNNGRAGLLQRMNLGYASLRNRAAWWLVVLFSWCQWMICENPIECIGIAKLNVGQLISKNVTKLRRFL